MRCVRRAPEGCIWIAPTPEMISAYLGDPGPFDVRIPVPVFKDFAAVAATPQGDIATALMGWFYADGSAVPTAAWAAGDPNNGASNANPIEPFAAMFDNTGLLVDVPADFFSSAASRGIVFAFYQCCIPLDSNTCTELTES
ncbi:MAG: hypothetical protein SGILL_005283 [Bacillariaceae sp.]